MNKHLNLFRTYSKTERTYQLENDLTRALAICLQEDALFLHEVLKSIFDGDERYNKLFQDINSSPKLKISIQKKTESIKGYKHIYAVSLSEAELVDFWGQTQVDEYDPVCDLVLTINDVCIVIEAKRDGIDCTAQLFNQIFNILRKDELSITECKDMVTDRDLNWQKLMAIAVKVSSFEKMSGNKNRFLADFIQLVRDHNPEWLPATPIASLNANSFNAIYRRIRIAVEEFVASRYTLELLNYNDRLGTTFSKGWADEVLFEVSSDKGDLVSSIYPANTKAQGWHIFHKDPQFSTEILLNGQSYSLAIGYHVKFSGQGYISGLWFDKSKMKKNLYTHEIFKNKTGRYSRDTWSGIEELLDEHLSYDWRKQSEWKMKILDSNRTVINMAIGYVITLTIPKEALDKLDTQIYDTKQLTKLIGNIYDAFETDLIKS
ncbi:hypothetical protein [Vibrio neonatus]|uniref:hypothetical protein n=1 Tax=Vibrio neonatus TaxID=278860 RepID=UPI0021C4C0BA|nr:hypothetical protein [Vibrio neonatus]